MLGCDCVKIMYGDYVWDMFVLKPNEKTAI